MQYIHSTKKGFVLSIVLWIVVVLLLGTTTLALFSKDTIGLSSSLKDKLETTITSQDVLNMLIYHIETSSYDNISLLSDKPLQIPYKMPKRLVLDNRWYHITKNIKIRLQDTSALINTIIYDPKLIAVLATDDFQNQLQHTIKDSIKDWIDEDNFISLNGAEISTYKLSKKKSFKARNTRAIQSPEELRLINGIDSLTKDAWKALKNRLYYADGVTPNLCLVDAKHLAYLVKINKSQAEALVNIRKNNLDMFIKQVSALDGFRAEQMGFHLSKQIIIEIEVTKNKSKSILKTIIQFQPTKYKQYTTIKYRSW